jgi:hypothetical protein
VRLTGQRFTLNMISAISPRGNLRFMVARGDVDSGHRPPVGTGRVAGD